jgi:hypothetical protein
MQGTAAYRTRCRTHSRRGLATSPAAPSTDVSPTALDDAEAFDADAWQDARARAAREPAEKRARKTRKSTD